MLPMNISKIFRKLVQTCPKKPERVQISLEMSKLIEYVGSWCDFIYNPPWTKEGHVRFLQKKRRKRVLFDP